MPKKVKRLFEQFQPEHYELSIEPDVESMTFSGSVTIRGRKVGPPSQRITLHQKDIRVSDVKVIKHDKNGDKKVAVGRVNTQKSFDELRIHAGETLYPGTYTINLTFSGKITKSLRGVYPCFYKHKGKEKIIVATQLESHHAREVFPCIDEPEAKSSFDVIYTGPKDQTVLSNMPAKSTKTNGNKVTTAFETTPIMSVYLLAFVAGELHAVETKSKAGVAVRSWGTVAQSKSHLEYATKEASDILDFFADYFETPYPLPKLDQVALPDFDAAAMENWGVVTYRESVLLTDPKNRSISNEQFATQVIAHELSHQWFGNLVTMKWWNELWLNESFAGLMEHVAPAALHPDWQQWEQWAIQDIALITSRDTYKDIQSISVDVDDPELIETLFDPAIVYAKGARLLKMLREYIGEEAFVKGLKSYFSKNAYGNASRHDLWAALGKPSGKDIESLMTPWLTQAGMPVVHATQNGGKLSLTQERFMLDEPADDTLWPIPLLANKNLEPGVLDTTNVELDLALKDFVTLNNFASGQYITHYVEPAHIDYISQQLKESKLPTEARINVLNDMYMLARHGDASLVDSLDTVKELAHEPRDSVWGIIARAIGAASQLTEGDKTSEDQIKKLKLTLAKDWHKKLGWDDQTSDDPNTIQLRHTMVALMISGEDPVTIKEALLRYKNTKTLQDINAEIRATILVAVVKDGDKKEISKLLETYSLVGADIQQDITSALSATKDPEIAQHILSTALGPEGFVRSQDVMRWVALLLRNHHTRKVMWDYMVKEWDWLYEVLDASKGFGYLPVYCASVVSTKEWKKKYIDFFEPRKSIKAMQRNITIGLADIDARIAWRTRDEVAIKKWLENFTKGG